MSGKDKDQVTQDGMVDLDEDDLGAVEGGVKWRSVDERSWKVQPIDSTGNDPLTNEADKMGWKVTVDNISIGNVKK